MLTQALISSGLIRYSARTVKFLLNLDVVVDQLLQLYKKRVPTLSKRGLTTPNLTVQVEFLVQCNLDLVTLNLVTTCDLVTIFQRPFFN